MINMANRNITYKGYLAGDSRTASMNVECLDTENK